MMFNSLPLQHGGDTSKPHIEVADIFRTHGEAFRKKNHLELEQLDSMKDIEVCRTAALGGHADLCQDCGHVEVSYNSCRNRHCPKCQGIAQASSPEA